jgi:hypothetical protein
MLVKLAQAIDTPMTDQGFEPAATSTFFRRREFKARKAAALGACKSGKIID